MCQCKYTSIFFYKYQLKKSARIGNIKEIKSHIMLSKYVFIYFIYLFG